MAKKPKEKWQIEVRAKLDTLGVTYSELAHELDLKEGTVRQVMCKDNMPRVKSKICEYLGVEA